MDSALIKKEDSCLLQYNKCDATDYMASVACGAIAGLIDIFFVGAPGDSILGNWTDTQVDTVVMKYAKMVGWSPKEGKEASVTSAIGFLERNFKVNYDQRHTADVGGLFNMSTKNHHLKSLAHSPDPIGLFFSILNQFTSTSSFVSGGKLITIQTETFELQGHNLPSKLFCGVSNWFGHIMSDIAGSSGSRGNAGRGSGVALPFFELFQFCSFGEFDIGKDKQDLATLATRVFQEGYDARHSLTMAIPVLLCDLSIRLIWVIKHYFYFKQPLKECVPDKTHESLRVMLLFGNGTLCLMDGADAAIRSNGNWLLLFSRMNLIAWAHFVSLVFKEICIRAGISLSLQEHLDSYKKINAALQSYMLQLQAIDAEAFQREVKQYTPLTAALDHVQDEQELNVILRKTMINIGIELPWNGTFDSFMHGNDHLVFE